MFFRDTDRDIWNLLAFAAIVIPGDPRTATAIKVIAYGDAGNFTRWGAKNTERYIVSKLKPGFAMKFMNWLAGEMQAGKQFADVSDFQAKFPDALPQANVIS